MKYLTYAAYTLMGVAVVVMSFVPVVPEAIRPYLMAGLNALSMLAVLAMAITKMLPAPAATPEKSPSPGGA